MEEGTRELEGADGFGDETDVGGCSGTSAVEAGIRAEDEDGGFLSIGGALPDKFLYHGWIGFVGDDDVGFLAEGYDLHAIPMFQKVGDGTF